MSEGLFDLDDDANTPLAPAERDGLIPSYITLRRELNEAEQANINDAERWAFARRRAVLDATVLRALHKRMLGKVWRWAGRYRTTERNIGVAPALIETELRILLDDARYQVDQGTLPPDEIAARFHHRLVSVHPFPNGNGRHARMATDLLLVSLGRPRFSWGGGDLTRPASDVRKAYVAALRAADGHDIGPLLAFVRT